MASSTMKMSFGMVLALALAALLCQVSPGKKINRLRRRSSNYRRFIIISLQRMRELWEVETGAEMCFSSGREIDNNNKRAKQNSMELLNKKEREKREERGERE